MSLDLYQGETADRLATLSPVQQPEPGAFDGFVRGAGLATMRGLARTARSIDLAGAIGPIAQDAITGGTTAQDRYFQEHEQTWGSAVDYWTPKPNEVGVAGEMVGQLLSTLGLVIVNPSLAVAEMQLGTGEDLVRKGVPAAKAEAVGALQAGGLGLGVWMPILGQNLWQRVLVGGAGYNLAQGAVTRGASGLILEGTPQAEEFKMLDPAAMTLDALLGMAFGGLAHASPAMRVQGKAAWERISAWAENLTPSDVAALAALRQAQHLNVDSAPGTPASPADVQAHVARTRQAIEQLSTDQPVEVSDLPEPTFTPDPARQADSAARAKDLVTEAERIRVEEGLPPPPQADLATAHAQGDLTALLPDEQARAIGLSVREQLERTGMDPEEAAANATLWESFFRTAGERYGVAPAEIMKRYGVNVRVMRADERLMGALEQAAGPKTFFQGEPAGQLFYSELGRQLDAAPMNQAPAQSWKDYVRGLAQKGVKPDEVKWSGLEEWLDLQPGKVTKEQVQAFLNGNGVQVRETMLGERPRTTPTDRAIAPEVERLTAQGFHLSEDPGAPGHWGITTPDGDILADTGDARLAFGEDAFTLQRDSPNADWKVVLDRPPFRVAANLGADRTEQMARLTARSEIPGAVRIPPEFQDLVRDLDRVLEHLNGDRGQGEHPEITAQRQEHREEIAQEEYRRTYDQLSDGQRAQVDQLEETEWGIEGTQMEADSRPATTKFGSYQLPGAKEGSYRELLLTLPDTKNMQRFIELGKKSFNERTAAENEEYRQLGTGEPGARFRSSHWDEPNILAHVRFNERTDAQGKRVLFLEEIQSDWAQQGKKPGGFITERPLYVAYYEVHGQKVDLGFGETPAAAQSAIDPGWAGKVDVKVERRQGLKTGRIPTGPFVGKTEAWVGLTLKRMIAYAAQNGFDKIAWTTGEQQVERYTGALRNAVDEIEWKKTPEGVQLVGYKGAPGAGLSHNQGARLDLLQRRLAEQGHLSPEQQTELDRLAGARAGRAKVVDTTEKEDALSDAIGKSMAEQIRNDPAQAGTIRGENLKIDDTGMAAFYDRIVPNVAKDVLRKLGGAKIGDVTINVSKRQNLQLSEQPGFDITPAMREKARQGLPLFQSGARGQIQFGQGETVIGLFEKADRSTFVHETGHFFLQVTRDLASRRGSPAEAKDDWRMIEKWLGVERGAEIPVEAHEKFARGFEAYLATGQAPTPELRNVFQRFRDWLLQVYQSIQELGATITPEIQGVMDRMLTMQRQAEQPAGMPRPVPETTPEAQKTIEAYRAQAEAGQPVDPILVDRANTERVVDGNHRLVALQEAGVPPEIVPVPRAEAHQMLTEGATPRAVADALGPPKAEAPAAKPGGVTESPPPRGSVAGVETAGAKAPGKFFDETFQPPEAPVRPALTLQDEPARRMLQGMADYEAGWEQIGGRKLRADLRGGTVNFTEWIPRAEWWLDRPDKKMNEARVKEAVRKALAGEPLKSAEQRTVDYLLTVASERQAASQDIGATEWGDVAQDIRNFGLERTTADIVDTDKVARAVELNEAAVDRAAIQYQNDDRAFMAEVQRILDEAHPNREALASGQVRGAPAPEPGGRAPAGAPGEKPPAGGGEAGRPARGAEPADPIAAAADRLLAENPDRLVSIGQNPDGTPIVRTVREYLEAERADVALAREDAKLFELAAECLIRGS